MLERRKEKTELKKPGLYVKRLTALVGRIVVNNILASMIAGGQLIELDKTSSSIEITYDQTIRFRLKRNSLIEEELALNM